MSVIGIIDYGLGNLRSISNAMRVVSEEQGHQVRLLTRAEELAQCDRVILPGVGAFGRSMANLRDKGFAEAIPSFVATGRPFFGICLGYQVLFDTGFEGGEQPGLGLIEGQVRRLEVDLHVPHVGWNPLHFAQEHPLWEGIKDVAEPAHVYFVHSYFADQVEEAHVIARCEYGGLFTCAVAKDNVAGAQFHPEKSGPQGLQILANFLAWKP